MKQPKCPSCGEKLDEYTVKTDTKIPLTGFFCPNSEFYKMYFESKLTKKEYKEYLKVKGEKTK